MLNAEKILEDEGHRYLHGRTSGWFHEAFVPYERTISLEERVDSYHKKTNVVV